jgi:PhoPQ-activated pathogenicity-related protein
MRAPDALWLFLLAALIATAGSDTTALDRYAAAAPGDFRYRLVRSSAGEGYTSHVLDMTSQTWRKHPEVDRTIWHHWLTVVIPGQVRGDTGLLFIAGGSNDGRAPETADRGLIAAALATRSVVIELRMVPNQRNCR